MIPAQVVQIYIAISASEASGRVERLQRAEPGPSSGGYRRTVRRAQWWALAECVARGGDHAATVARSWQASQASGDSRNDALKEGNLIGLSTRFVVDPEVGARERGSSPGGGPRASAVGIHRWSDVLGRCRIRRGSRRERARGPGRHTSVVHRRRRARKVRRWPCGHDHSREPHRRGPRSTTAAGRASVSRICATLPVFA